MDYFATEALKHLAAAVDGLGSCILVASFVIAAGIVIGAIINRY